jgi:hypothetical protein
LLCFALHLFPPPPFHSPCSQGAWWSHGGLPALLGVPHCWILFYQQARFSLFRHLVTWHYQNKCRHNLGIVSSSQSLMPWIMLVLVCLYIFDNVRRQRGPY